MAFNGYLIKVGESGVEIPVRYIASESYKTTPQQRMEDDAYRDNTGYLHRVTVPNTPVKIEFNTVPLYNDDMDALSDILSNAFEVVSERKLKVDFYDTFSHSYKTGYCYVPDIDYTILNIDVENNRILYDGVRIAFIGY